ncbi:MAG: hypothetical protein ACI4XM_04210 [Candidatus Coprovivens sp.]
MEEFQIASTLFWEALITIPISLCVFFPIANIINKGKKNQIFCILFIIRIIYLIIGNITLGGIMAIIDIMSVFFGLLILIPALGWIKYTFPSRESAYKEYNEVSEIELSNHGIEDRHLLEQKLLKLYQDYENARNNYDKTTLKKICTEKQYNETISNLDLYSEVNQRKYNIINEIIDVKTVDVSHSLIYTTITLLIKVSMNSYVEDSIGKIVKGKKNRKIIKKQRLKFIKKITKSSTITNKKCDSCGAPIKENDLECTYCGLSTGHTVRSKDWLIEDIDQLVK